MAGKKNALVLAGVPRVNLMPRAENERRERIALTRTWAILAMGALAVAAAVIAGAFGLRLAADQALAAEQARTVTLTTELLSYSDVSQGLAAARAREVFRAEAGANDFAWTPLVNSLIAALPDGVTLIEYSIAPGTAPVADSVPEDEVGGTATLTFSAVDPRNQANAVAALVAVPGVLSADAAELHTAGEESYEFVISVVFDQTIYSGDFAADEGTR